MDNKGWLGVGHSLRTPLALPSASARRFLMYGPDLACGGGHATAVGDGLSGAALGHDKLASQTRRG
ncbi:hypothetical protein CKO27_10835 [Thiocystis violacea]|nr:hypothetical protein [Thiocystis violacea]